MPATSHAVLWVDFPSHDNLTICLFFRCNPMVLQAYSHCHGDCLESPRNTLRFRLLSHCHAPGSNQVRLPVDCLDRPCHQLGNLGDVMPPMLWLCVVHRLDRPDHKMTAQAGALAAGIVMPRPPRKKISHRVKKSVAICFGRAYRLFVSGA